MRGFARALALLALTVVVPSLASAQATIAGVVRDTSGAVLPGVTIEAASPVLIEKVRTAVSDGNGRFQIIDLRPGTYTVTFTLTGFNTVRRDGVMLGGAAVVSVDADLRVGSLEETITVTGEAPTVDVQTATRQTVLDRDVVQAIPTGRNYYSLGTLINGVTSNSNDVGGALGDTMSSLTIHGSKNQDQRIMNNGVGIMTLQAGGNIGGATPDVSSASEITVDTSAVNADLPTGGVRINLIPRDGGNTWASSNFFTFTNEGLQGNNLTQRLQDLGVPTPTKTILTMDVNPAFGGPIRRDKIWFWATGRYTKTEDGPAGSFANKNAYNPALWTYEADPSRPGRNKGVWHSLQTRFTWQAAAKHKVAATWQEQSYCRCPWFISATAAPETGQDRRFPRLQQQHAEWTSPLTNRLLVEAVGMHLYERWGNMHLRASDGNFFKLGGSLDDPATEEIQKSMIAVLEQSSGLLYRGPAAVGGNVNNQLFNTTSVPNYFYRAAMSYVTGTHNFKAGFNRVHGYLTVYNYDFQPLTYRFNNGAPNLITMRATPYETTANQDNDFGLFAQDRYTLNRWTLSGGIRFDMFQTSYPEQRIGPGPLVPNRNLVLPETENLDWKDITYRSAATWDVFGDGKTALKLTLNKYLQGQTLNGLGVNANPFNTLVNTVTRSWNDRNNLGINNDYVPQCDLLNPAANGECGQMSDPAFGTSRPGATFSDLLRKGWGHRNYNWEFSAGVQREILPRVSVDVGYFRRWFGNFQVTDNLAVAASDYDVFSLTVPSDPRLPDGGAYTVDGLVDLKPAAFGRVAQLYNTLDSEYGAMKEHWNGVDFGLNARLQNGITLAGGVSTGKRMVDFCDITNALPEMLFPTGNAPINLNDPNNNTWLPGQFCHQEEPMLTTARMFAVYTIPRIDVLVSGTFQSTPGALVAANFVATNAILASSSTLGRPLSGGAANIPVNVVEPGAMYVERLNQLDLRFGKVFRFGARTRTSVNLDVYNALNADTIRTVNNAYGSWMPGGPRPTAILLARFAKISATIDF
jgi:hypothetical protein